jgi:predicted ferric reductase
VIRLPHPIHLSKKSLASITKSVGLLSQYRFLLFSIILLVISQLLSEYNYCSFREASKNVKLMLIMFLHSVYFYSEQSLIILCME